MKWAIVGSTGLALRGIPILPHDIDLMTDAEGAYEIEREFSEYVTEKVAFRTSEKLRSHFGKLQIDGIVVEIMGDLQVRSTGRAWEDLLDMDGNRQFVAVEQMDLPVLSLECEHEASIKLGRTERAEMLRTHMAEKKRV